MIEKNIENHLKKQVEKMGGMAIKLLPSINGLPDRIILLPQGEIYFIECKRLGEKPRPLQKAIHRKLENLGFKVLVIDSKESVDKFMEGINWNLSHTSINNWQ